MENYGMIEGSDQEEWGKMGPLAEPRLAKSKKSLMLRIFWEVKSPIYISERGGPGGRSSLAKKWEVRGAKPPKSFDS